MSEDLSKYFEQIQNESDFFSKAKLIQFLKEKKGLKIVEIAKKLRIQPTYVCHILRLNRLPDLIVDGYYQKMISLSHLFILSRIKDKQKLNELYEEILEKGFTIFQTEEKVREILHNIKSKGLYLNQETKNSYVSTLEKTYSNSKVKIFQSRIKGFLKVEIKGSLEETTKTLQKMIEKLS